MTQIYQFLILDNYGIPAILLFFFFLQLYYPFFTHNVLANYEADDYDIDVQDLAPVSVVICARNEYENLKQFLPLILEQNHPNFEVVVVNDRSSDETEDFLTELSVKYAHLQIVTVVDSYKFKFSKKYAATMGIKKAQNETLIFTDADCIPDSAYWLRGMQHAYSADKQIVLGYSPYVKLRGFLNKLIRFETLFTAINYFSYVLKGKAYMGVGRNLSYQRSLFFKNKGFASHIHVLSGDDDLFVNETATPENVAIQLHPATFTSSLPKTTFGSYCKQKFRHFGASKLYKKSHKRMLSWQLFVQMMFHFSWITALFFNDYSRYIAIGILVLNYLIKMIAYRKIFRKLHCGDLIVWFPLLELSHSLFLFFFGIFSQVSSKKATSWK